MLTHHLNNAIKDINHLIEQTNKDIDDIKLAKHTQIFERTAIKNDLIHSFEQKKSLLDYELSKILKESGKSSLEELLNDEQKELLNLMKTNYLKKKLWVYIPHCAMDKLEKKK